MSITGIYLVTDPLQCAKYGLVPTIRAAVDAGVTTVQVRDKTTPASQLLGQLEHIAALTKDKVTLLVDDHLEVVVTARQRGIPVDGLHLGQTDVSVSTAREQLGDDAVIGLSANTIAHVTGQGSQPIDVVDYLGVGAIHATGTKSGATVVGVDGFAQLGQHTELPLIAIGGVNRDDIAPLRAAGASGIAVVSAICAAPDPGQAAADLVAAWNAAAVG